MKALLVVVAVLVASGLAVPAQAQWAATGYVDNDVAGDVQAGRLGVGLSAGYYLRGRLGLELDGELHGHFFRDEDVASLAPSGVDLNTKAALAFANVVVPLCLRGAAGIWCPYLTGGVGVIHASFDGRSHLPGVDDLSRTQTNLAFDLGGGVMHAFTRWFGFRVDARYIHALVDETSTTGGYFKDYGYCRLSVGFTFGGPQSAAALY